MKYTTCVSDREDRKDGGGFWDPGNMEERSTALSFILLPENSLADILLDLLCSGNRLSREQKRTNRVKNKGFVEVVVRILGRLWRKFTCCTDSSDLSEDRSKAEREEAES